MISAVSAFSGAQAQHAQPQKPAQIRFGAHVVRSYVSRSWTSPRILMGWECQEVTQVWSNGNETTYRRRRANYMSGRNSSWERF